MKKHARVQQINRAAVSAASNIAEGTSRNGCHEEIHFINVSYSSLMEIVWQTAIAFELGYLTKDAFEKYRKRQKTSCKNEQLYCINQNTQYFNYIYSYI